MNSNIKDYFKCIRGSNLLQSTSWKEASKHKKSANDFLFIIFVSHRWESIDSSDPNNKQFNAVKSLILHIKNAIKTILEIDKNPYKYIPFLNRHGILEGAILATRLFNVVWQNNNQLKKILQKTPEKLIGIWYDEACLPQNKKTKEEIIEFQQALKHLPDFIKDKKVNLIALREKEDNYENRAWCMMEFMVATNQIEYNTPFLYRFDLDKDKINIDKTSNKTSKEFEILLNEWNKGKMNAFDIWKAIFLSFNISSQHIVGENSLPIFSLKNSLANFVVTQQVLYSKEKKLINKKPLDILEKLSMQTNLQTTLKEDRLLVYLMILTQGSTQDNLFRKEIEIYLDKIINKKV